MEQSSLQAYAEQYFSSGNNLNRRILQDIETIRESYEDTWEQLDQRKKEKVINEHIITPEVAMQISSQEKSTSFPRLKIAAGQKMIMVEGNSSESGENKGYSYRDEHSSPFSWKTRSQQDLNFDVYSNSRGSTPETGSFENLEISSRRSGSSPTPDSPAHAQHSTPLTPSAGSAENLEIVSARRSAILSCPFGQYTKLRREAKPVSIPTVPQLKNNLINTHKKSNKIHCDETKLQQNVVQDVDQIISLTSSVVVADSSNNIVIDFTIDTQDSIPASSTQIQNEKDFQSSSTFSSTLSSFVKGKTSTLKKSLTPTLRRKKSTASTDTTCSVATECEFVSAGQSLSSTPTHDDIPRYSPSRSYLKPSHPPPPPPSSRPSVPPPPPPTISKPKPCPPLPPTRDPKTKISQSSLEGTENIYQNDSQVTSSWLPETSKTNADSTKQLSSSQPPQLSAKEKDQTSQNIIKKEGIPKTGFDFLDNW